MKTAVIIPSYNPNDKLLQIICELVDYGFTSIIIVNDGSKKECNNYFEKISKIQQCSLLNHAVNQGKGRALKTAFNYYLNTHDMSEYIGAITIDADGQHLVNDVVTCSNALQKNRTSLILGCRNFNLSEVPPKSKIGNKITSGVFKTLLGIDIKDTQTGLRGIPNNFIKTCLTIDGERFEYETNMLLKAKQ